MAVGANGIQPRRQIFSVARRSSVQINTGARCTIYGRLQIWETPTRDMDRIFGALAVVDNWNLANWQTVSASGGTLGAGLGAQKGRMGLGRTDAPGSSLQPTRTRRAMPSGPVASSWPSKSSCGALGRLLPDSRSPTSRIRQGRADPPHL